LYYNNKLIPLFWLVVGHDKSFDRKKSYALYC
jgi:hypothetical protein